MTPDEMAAFEREYAIKAHDRDIEQQNRLFDTVIQYGLAALKGSSLICGGSVVVGLAFAGTLYSSEPDTAKALIYSVLLFAMGAVFTGIASGFAYFSQGRYAQAAYEKVHQWEHPYVLPKQPENPKLEKKGDFWRNATITMVIISYACVFAGIAAFWCAIA